MSKALMIIGVVVALISGLADVIGIGDNFAFGRYQITGTLLGLMVLGIGWITRTPAVPTSARAHKPASAV